MSELRNLTQGQNMTEDHHTDTGDYVAKYRLRDRFAISAFFLLLLGAPFIPGLHFGRPFLILCFVAILLCATVVYRAFFFMVVLRDAAMDIQMPPFFQYTEQYSEIVALIPIDGNLKISFRDGRSVLLQSGCGNLVEIMGILERKTTVTITQ